MINKFLNILFPKKCLNCGKYGSYLCEDCFIKYNLNFKIFKISNKSYEYFMYLDEYKNDIRTKILKFKFYDAPYMNEFFLEFLDNKSCDFLKKFDIIIPVPMYKDKMLRRGYNQTELISKNLSKKINVKYHSDVLIKLKSNKTQSLLNKKERIENVKNVFEIQNSEKINGKNIILVDDIFTTGATALECSKLLKNKGANNICVLVISKAK